MSHSPPRVCAINFVRCTITREIQDNPQPHEKACASCGPSRAYAIERCRTKMRYVRFAAGGRRQFERSDARFAVRRIGRRRTARTDARRDLHPGSCLRNARTRKSCELSQERSCSPPRGTLSEPCGLPQRIGCPPPTAPSNHTARRSRMNRLAPSNRFFRQKRVNKSVKFTKIERRIRSRNNEFHPSIPHFHP